MIIRKRQCVRVCVPSVHWCQLYIIYLMLHNFYLIWLYFELRFSAAEHTFSQLISYRRIILQSIYTDYIVYRNYRLGSYYDIFCNNAFLMNCVSLNNYDVVVIENLNDFLWTNCRHRKKNWTANLCRWYILGVISCI